MTQPTRKPMRQTGHAPRWIRWLRPTTSKVLLLVGLGIVAGGLYWYYDGGRYRWVKKRWGEVVPGVIYRSGQLHANLVEETLRDYGIRIVVDLDEDRPNEPSPKAERAAIANLRIRSVNVEGLDGSGIGSLDAYVVALREMKQAHDGRLPILVHCAAGSKRTGAAVAFYRMLVQGWDGPTTHAEFERYIRWHSRSTRLARFIQASLKPLATKLVAAGVLPHLPTHTPLFEPGTR